MDENKLVGMPFRYESYSSKSASYSLELNYIWIV